MADLNRSAYFLDALSNIHNAIATIKASAMERDSDAILALQHAAEALIDPVGAAEDAGPGDLRDRAYVRVACLAELIDKVNVEIDDQLLHAASVLLHVANEQLVVPEPT